MFNSKLNYIAFVFALWTYLFISNQSIRT